MYPQAELKRLARTRAFLHRRIAAQRGRIGDAAGEVAVPVHRAEQLWAGWKSISPLLKLGAVPVGLWFQRRRARSGGVASLLKSLPTLLHLFRLFGSRRRAA